MTHNKEKIINDIISQVRLELKKDNLSFDKIYSEDQMYFLLDKYIEAPSFSLQEAKAAYIIMNNEKESVSDYSFSYFPFNFKNCFKDFVSIFPDVLSISTDGTPGFMKWIIIGKIVLVLNKLFKMSWGTEEYLILRKIYFISNTNFIEKSRIIDEIITEESPNGRTFSETKLNNSIQNLIKYKCLSCDNQDTMVKLNKHIYIRGLDND